MDLVWTSQLRRKDKKSALEFLIHPLAPAGRDEATPVVGAPAVQEIHAEEQTGRCEATPATVAAKEETRGLNGSLAVGQEAEVQYDEVDLLETKMNGEDRRRRFQAPQQVGRDEATLAIDAAVTATPGARTGQSGRREAGAEAEVPSEGTPARAATADNQWKQSFPWPF